MNSDQPADLSQGEETEAEKLKRKAQEAEILKVSPVPETHVGPDTVGVGQPTAQSVNQGQSLPPTAIPVDKNFEGRTNQFYDPVESKTQGTD